MTALNRLDRAQQAYVMTFNLLPPFPFGPNDDEIAQVLEDAVAAGKPLPSDYNWWAGIPKGGVA